MTKSAHWWSHSCDLHGCTGRSLNNMCLSLKIHFSRQTFYWACLVFSSLIDIVNLPKKTVQTCWHSLMYCIKNKCPYVCACIQINHALMTFMDRSCHLNIKQCNHPIIFIMYLPVNMVHAIITPLYSGRSTIPNRI